MTSSVLAMMERKSLTVLLIALGLAGSTLAIYWAATRNDFVNYDDSDYVTANAHVQSGLKRENVAWAFHTGHASNWHPLTWLSHMLDIQLFGENADRHHLTSVLFHTANAVVLFLLLRGMTGAMWRSAFVAALFALHPLHVESVAWVSERKDVLSAFFGLLCLGAYAGYVKRVETGSGRVSPVAWYILALVLLALGLMSKPMLVTWPFVLLLLDWWPLGRLEGKQSKLKAFGLLVLEKIPFFALSVASCVVTYLVQRKGGAVSASISPGDRIANALVSYVRYIGKMFWPNDLSVLYPHPGTWPATQVIASAVFLVAISAGVIAVALRPRGRPWLVVGWFWFVGTLVPTIGLVQVGIQSMADRYSYLPLIGLFIIIAWGAAEVAGWFALARDENKMVKGKKAAEPSQGSKRQKALVFVLAIGAAACIAVCAVLTVTQIGYWRNSETLFRQATRVTKNNYLAYNNLGFYLSGQGKVEEAMECYRRSLEISPGYEEAHNNLGYALAGQKKYAEAIAHYQKALRTKPDNVEVHNNLGNALSETGDIPGAIEQYRFVLLRKPDHADAHNNLGIALAMQGKFDEAISHFHEAIRFKRNYASAHSNLGNALAVQHKLDEAIREYQESLRLKPEDAQAHNNLGNALAEQGKLAEAVGHYTEALRLNADNPEAHFNLGMVLERQGKRTEAITHYTEALRLKPDYAEARRQLDGAHP